MKTFSKSTIKYFFLRNDAAVKEVYMETYRLLFHISNSILKSKEDAEDNVMKTYEKAMYFDYSKIKNSKSFIAFLCAICKNNCLDLLKKRKNEVSVDLDEESISKKDEYSLVIADLKKLLSNEQYDIFFFKEYYGLSFKEISPLVDKSIGRCRSLLFEAKKILRENKELFL